MTGGSGYGEAAMLIILALVAGFSVLIVALCVKPIEGGLRALRSRRRQSRRRRRNASEERAFQSARAARQNQT